MSPIVHFICFSIWIIAVIALAFTLGWAIKGYVHDRHVVDITTEKEENDHV